MGMTRLSDRDRVPSISLAPSGHAKLRVVVRMLTTPHGKKTAIARLLASECGRSLRAVYRWQQVFREHGFAGLSHSRADKGVPRLYSATEFESVILASIRLRRHTRSNVRREWKSLRLPGSYETCRSWVRRLQAFGYVEVSPSGERGELSA